LADISGEAPMYLVTASEMQEMDRRTIKNFGIPGMVLMENAGRGATRFFLEQFPDIENHQVGVIRWLCDGALPEAAGRFRQSVPAWHRQPRSG
jgi:hypothetical protein